MPIAIQVISSHPLLVRAVEEILAGVEDFAVLPSAANEEEAMSRPSLARLFLLDACSLRIDLGPVVQRCRSHSPGSKFLALLSPADGGHADKVRLFYCGIDGFVELHAAWQAELLQAIRSIQNGEHWVPREVLMAFVKQMKALQDTQLLPGHSLTAREGQILQLLVRHLTNKAISKALSISERTVKFHVSNILAKLGVEDRQALLPEALDGNPPMRPDDAKA
ncbi:MAG TPA: response regulator transcription factor [Xanthobacteraceae bacterium]|nr:response regulator transcription factor [Xanthobacteraceae bacterium]